MKNVCQSRGRNSKAELNNNAATEGRRILPVLPPGGLTRYNFEMK